MQEALFSGGLVDRMLFKVEGSLGDNMESRCVRPVAMKCVKRDW